MKKTGGFFPLHLPEKNNKHSLARLWKLDQYSSLFFSNGRSALHHLINKLSPSTLWLPAYCCAALAQAAVNTSASIRYFPLQGFTPDVDFLRRNIKASDMVVAVDYFGRAPDAAFRELAASRPDITWVEDRAQAIAPGEQWGEYILYSPRKVVGVADGGIIVNTRGVFAEPAHVFNEDTAFASAALLRYEDVQEAHNNVWYDAYKHSESSMKISQHAMSRLSRYILSYVDARPLIKKRKANYEVLSDLLSDIAMLPVGEVDFVPLGLPIKVNNKPEVAAFLHKKGIFAASHWPDMPSPEAEFASEHAMCSNMLTLPVDHRYGKADMKRIAKLVRKAIETL